MTMYDNILLVHMGNDDQHVSQASRMNDLSWEEVYQKQQFTNASLVLIIAHTDSITTGSAYAKQLATTMGASFPRWDYEYYRTDTETFILAWEHHNWYRQSSYLIHALTARIMAQIIDILDLGAARDNPFDIVLTTLTRLPPLAPYATRRPAYETTRENRLVKHKWTKTRAEATQWRQVGRIRRECHEEHIVVGSGCIYCGYIAAAWWQHGGQLETSRAAISHEPGPAKQCQEITVIPVVLNTGGPSATGIIVEAQARGTSVFHIPCTRPTHKEPWADIDQCSFTQQVQAITITHCQTNIQ